MSGSLARLLSVLCPVLIIVSITCSWILTRILQIFSYLHPMDVLNLSRTTKRLRSILLASHAGGVWRSALGSVRALPSCPSDMTEPQYASLAFDDWCQVGLMLTSFAVFVAIRLSISIVIVCSRRLLTSLLISISHAWHLIQK